MTDLRKNQGPLGSRFSPNDEEGLPFVTEVIEENGQPGSKTINQEVGLAQTLHFSDWGSLDRAFYALRAAIEDCDEPPTGIVRVMRKSDGEVLHVIHLNILPFGTPELEALKRLLHYSWEDIAYDYDDLTDSEKAAVGREEFESLKKWIGAE